MADEQVIRVIIVDDIADTREQLEKLLFFEKDIKVIAKAGNGREALELAKQQRPDVILMDINMPEMDGITATEAIVSFDPTIQVIIMSVQGETDYLRRAMLAGAREFLVKPISADDLYKSIRHVYKLAANRPRQTQQVASGGTAAAPGESDARGQVIAVFGPKGGVGTSSIAANLAIAIRQTTNKKVVLMDGNLTLGDMNVILNLVSTRTIVDLADRINELDSDLVNSVLAPHTSQIKVLLAPPNPQTGELVTAEHVRTIVDFLRRDFDYVIVDTPASFQDRTLAVLDSADRIVVLMTMELTSLKNIKHFFEVTNLLGYSSDKMMLVLNKADNSMIKMGFSVKSVEENIQRKVTAQIFNAPVEMAMAINQGVPLVISDRNQRTSKDILALAGMITNILKPADDKNKAASPQAAPTKPPEQRGLLGGLLRR